MLPLALPQSWQLGCSVEPVIGPHCAFRGSPDSHRVSMRSMGRRSPNGPPDWVEADAPSQGACVGSCAARRAPEVVTRPSPHFAERVRDRRPAVVDTRAIRVNPHPGIRPPNACPAKGLHGGSHGTLDSGCNNFSSLLSFS